MSAIDDLQEAVSRYAPVAGFGEVAATSQIDPITVSAVVDALSWIRDHVSAESANAAGLLNQLTSGGFDLIGGGTGNTAAAITKSAPGLAAYLNQVADSNNLGSSNLALPGVGTAVRNFWGGLPSWVPYAGGGVVLLLVGWAIVRRKLPAM